MAVPLPMLLQVTAQVTVAPTEAGFGVHATVLLMSGSAPTTTVAVAVSQAAGVAVAQILYGTV